MSEHDRTEESVLWSNFFSRDERKDILTMLRGVPIFEDLSRRDLKALERILHLRKYHAGEYIFREGDPGLGMYIVEQGTVSIVSESRSRELSRLRKGEFFGEMALFNDRPRNASAVAFEDTRLRLFPARFVRTAGDASAYRRESGVETGAHSLGAIVSRRQENARLMEDAKRN